MPVLFAWPLEYNRAKLQWHTQRRKLCFFSFDDRLRITINTVINAIQNEWPKPTGWDVSAGCNTIMDWRSFAKTATFFGVDRNHSTTVKTMWFIYIIASSSRKWKINFDHFCTRFLIGNTRSSRYT